MLPFDNQWKNEQANAPKRIGAEIIDLVFSNPDEFILVLEAWLLRDELAKSDLKKMAREDFTLRLNKVIKKYSIQGDNSSNDIKKQKDTTNEIKGGKA